MTSHLIHIGLPKSGSTFLQRWFTRHPQIAYAEGGFAGFRDVFQLASEGASPPTHVKLQVTSCEGFALPHPSYGSAVFDHLSLGTVSLSEAQANVCGRLAASFPAARILIVTRGFESMILSLYSQVVRGGGTFTLEELCRFLELLEEQGDSPFQYSRLIAQYEGAFGSDNLIVLPFELLRDSPARFLGDLERRLCLDPYKMSHQPVNEALSPEEMRWYPRVTRALHALPLGRRVRDKIFARYVQLGYANRLRRPIRLLQKIRPAPPVLASEIPASLIARFRGHADRLRSEPLFQTYEAEYFLD